jgi:iron complex outermembrane receptor protein
MSICRHSNGNHSQWLRTLQKLLLSAALGAGADLMVLSIAEAEGTAEESNNDPKAIEDDAYFTPVIVSADPLAPSILEFSRPASILEGQRLEERIQGTLGETIDLQPGVRSSFFGAGASRPVIRGFSGERVRTLRNGVSTGDVSSFSEDHVVVADPLQAEQIEILRGPETLLYGSSAIGGAVNVTDGSIAEYSLGKPFEGSIIGQFGNSADNEKSEAIKLRGESGSINWYGSAFSRKTDSYEIPGVAESERLRQLEESVEEDETHQEHEDEEVSGIVPNTDTETFGGTVGVSHLFERGFIGGSVSGFDSNYGVPGHSHGHDEEHEEGQETIEGFDEDEDHEGDDSVRIDAKQVRGDIRGRYDLEEFVDSIKFRFGATNYEHTEFEGDAIGTVFEKDGVEGRAEFVHRPIGSVSGVFGLHTIYDDFSATGEEAFLPPTESLTRALFLYEKAQLTERFALQGGGRIEAVTHDPTSGDGYDALPGSGSAGFLWDLDSDGMYSMSSSLAYTERAASPIELYADGIHYARRIAEQGNRSLSEERATGIDFALRKNDGFFTASLTPFYQYFHDYFNLRALEGANEEFPLYEYERTGASFWGGEFVSALHIDQFFSESSFSECGHTLSLEFQNDIVRSRDRDRDSYIPRTPPMRNIVRARWGLPNSLQLMVEGVIVDDQKRLAEQELMTDGYTLLNSEMSYKLGDTARSVRLFVRGTNLTNEEARVHTSFLKDLAPLRGRSLLFGFKASL